MKKLAEEGVKLVICVDCGITAHEPLKEAKEHGLDVIVIDHHTAEAYLPPCIAAINPNRLDDPMAASLGHLAAVGVTYLFVVATNRALRQKGFYEKRYTEPNLLKWLDLVALGTVCDVVSLTGLNRAFVAQGLKIMEARQNQGIAALAEVAGARREMDTYTAGFLLGPRINAGGRVGRSDMGARLLSLEDEQEVIGYAQRLNDLNHERRALEKEVLAEAELTIFKDEEPLCFVASENWHPGVIGIVASRLKDKYQRPSLVVSLTNGQGKGSGRSIGNIDLGAAVIAARQAGLLINGGGHKMAAGLTVARDKVDELHEFLTARIGKQLAAEPFEPRLTIDGMISTTAANIDFLGQLEKLAPFGTGNSEPRFALADSRIAHAQVVGESHVKVIAQQGTTRLEGIAFRAMETSLGPALLARAGGQAHLAGKLRRNVWQGRENVQMIIDDAAAG
jgi:single-stranded-DNA-specific exonuclease